MNKILIIGSAGLGSFRACAASKTLGVIFRNEYIRLLKLGGANEEM